MTLVLGAAMGADGQFWWQHLAAPVDASIATWSRPATSNDALLATVLNTIVPLTENDWASGLLCEANVLIPAPTVPVAVPPTPPPRSRTTSKSFTLTDTFTPYTPPPTTGAPTTIAPAPLTTKAPPNRTAAPTDAPATRGPEPTTAAPFDANVALSLTMTDTSLLARGEVRVITVTLANNGDGFNAAEITVAFTFGYFAPMPGSSCSQYFAASVPGRGFSTRCTTSSWLNTSASISFSFYLVTLPAVALPSKVVINATTTVNHGTNIVATANATMQTLSVGTQYKIEDFDIGLNDARFGSVISISGVNLTAMPKRMLLGPFVVSIATTSATNGTITLPKLPDNVRALIAKCPTILADQVKAAVSLLASNDRDRVMA